MSGFSWTVPDNSESAQPENVTRSNQLDRFGKDVFFDGDFAVNSRGDYVTIEGLPALRASILRRLVTRPGELRARPEYGVGVNDFVKKPATASTFDNLRVAIIDQLAFETRIDSVDDVAIRTVGSGISIVIRISVSGRTITFQPFNFNDVITLNDSRRPLDANTIIR